MRLETKNKTIPQMTTDTTCTKKLIVGKLYEQYADELHRYFVVYTHDSMSADDMLHDLFVKVLRLDVIEPTIVKHLLFRIARRIILDDIRHKCYVREYQKYVHCHYSEAETSHISEEIDNRTFLQMEERRLLSMPQKRAAVYRLWRSNEYTFQEISEQLNISRRTAETHVYTAVKDMKEFFRKSV